MRARSNRASLDGLLERLRTPPADPKAVKTIVDRALVVWDSVMARHRSGEARLSPAELLDHLKVLDTLHEAARVAIGAPPSSMSVH